MDSSHSLPSASRPGARAEASHPFPPWRLTYRVGVDTSEQDTDFAEAAGLRIEQAFALCSFASKLVGKASSVTTFDPARIFETLYRHGVDYVTIGAWAVITHGRGPGHCRRRRHGQP